MQDTPQDGDGRIGGLDQFETPQDGDVVLHCGHLNRMPPCWFFLATTDFTRPDGSRDLARFVMLCEACYVAAADPRTQVFGDLIWCAVGPMIQHQWMY